MTTDYTAGSLATKSRVVTSWVNGSGLEGRVVGGRSTWCWDHKPEERTEVPWNIRKGKLRDSTYKHGGGEKNWKKAGVRINLSSGMRLPTWTSFVGC